MCKEIYCKKKVTESLAGVRACVWHTQWRIQSVVAIYTSSLLLALRPIQSISPPVSIFLSTRPSLLWTLLLRSLRTRLTLSPSRIQQPASRTRLTRRDRWVQGRGPKKTGFDRRRDVGIRPQRRRSVWTGPDTMGRVSPRKPVCPPPSLPPPRKGGVEAGVQSADADTAAG